MSISHLKVSCKGYQADQIDSVWGVAKPLIQKALDRGSNYTIDEIHEGLLSNEMQLFMWMDKAALVTAIQTKRGKTFCLLLTLGGDSMSLWFEQLPFLEDWAKGQGAEEMRIYGRLGWARLTGYDIEYVKMVKQLCPVDQRT